MTLAPPPKPPAPGPVNPQAPRTPLATNQAPKPQPTTAQQSMGVGPIAGAKADIIYGATGSTKTSRLGDIAEYIMAKTGKRSRLISADPGGWAAIEDLVRTAENPKGIIEAFALIQHRNYLYETMEKLTLGWWPKDPADPQSELVPPQANNIREYGALLVEGVTSFCELMMRTNMTDLENINVPRSDAEKSNILKSGTTFKHRFASQTDYGSIQDIIAEFIRNSAMLPYNRVAWTGLEQRGEDDQKKPVYGPDFIGKKATGKCGPWFGNMIHMDFILVNQEVPDPSDPQKRITVQQSKPFMFLRPHIDPTDPFKIPWPAKVRVVRTMHDKIPNVMEPRMDKLYKLLDSLKEQEITGKTK